jgi:hypothetical protein
VGHVKEVRPDSFNVSGTASFANGDGLCFINARHELEGFRVNRAVGNRLYPFKMPAGLKPGTVLYRNNDEAFGKILAGDTAERRLPVCLTFGLADGGFCLTVAFHAPGSDQPVEATATVAFDHQKAQKPQADNIRRQLSKLGNTVYVCEQPDIMAVPTNILCRRAFSPTCAGRPSRPLRRPSSSGSTGKPTPWCLPLRQASTQRQRHGSPNTGDILISIMCPTRFRAPSMSTTDRHPWDRPSRCGRATTRRR